MTRLPLSITNGPGVVPDYMTVKEQSEIMERERANARVAVREFRQARTHMRASLSSYRAARRTYWRNWGIALAFWRNSAVQANGQGGAL